MSHLHLDSRQLLAGLAECETTLRRFAEAIPCSAPSMAEAAKIRDVAARHNYVFDNGLCSPDFFDLPKRMASEEFALLRRFTSPTDSVFEIGCFTGLNLLGLQSLGYDRLAGTDFVAGALQWLDDQICNIDVMRGTFPDDFGAMPGFSRVICFDVLEHQLNVGQFLAGASNCLKPDGRALFLVPIGREYYDCGHVAFFPDAECLRNVLDYVFDVEEIFELKTCRKLFASCRRRG